MFGQIAPLRCLFPSGEKIYRLHLGKLDQTSQRTPHTNKKKRRSTVVRRKTCNRTCYTRRSAPTTHSANHNFAALRAANLRRPEKKHTELSATSTELRQVSTWGETISRRPCESCNESFSESRTESYGGPTWSLQGFQGTPGVFQVRLRQRDSQQNPR